MSKPLLQLTMGADFDTFFPTGEISWAEVSDYEIPQDERSDAQIAADEVRSEQAIDHAHDA